MKPILLAVALVLASSQAYADQTDPNAYAEIIKIMQSQQILNYDREKLYCIQHEWNEPRALENCNISPKDDDAIGAIATLVSLGAPRNSVWVREHCKSEVTSHSCTWKGLTVHFY